MIVAIAQDFAARRDGLDIAAQIVGIRPAEDAALWPGRGDGSQPLGQRLVGGSRRHAIAVAVGQRLAERVVGGAGLVLSAQAGADRGLLAYQ